MAMDVIGIQIEKSIDVRINFAHQTPLDALAHHRALFAGDRGHVGIDVGQDCFAERHVEILPRPLRLADGAISQFEMVDSELPREFGRRAVQCRPLTSSLAAAPP